MLLGLSVCDLWSWKQLDKHKSRLLLSSVNLSNFGVENHLIIEWRNYFLLFANISIEALFSKEEGGAIFFLPK